MRKLGKTLFIISSAFLFLITACGGSAIGDAQQFEPNEPPVILSIKAVNFDGTEITQLDIEPYKQFKLIIEATDPDNNPLQYKFDSESGTFAGITANSTGCTAIFKTGRVVGGQNVEFWAGVSDGRGALVRQSYNLGTGKSGPTLVAILEKIRFRPGDKVKLSVTANCSGFFQFYSNGNNETEFKFENDMFRYSYSENKTTELILGGPKCASFADIQLEPRVDGIYGNDPNYNIVLVFRDGLFQTSRFIQEICVDGTPPEVIKDGFSPTGTGISTNPAVTVTFDEEIGYADSSCLKLLPDDGKVKLVSIDGKVVRFAVSGLKTSIPYTATVSGIKDIAGNEMLPDLPNSSISFTTRSDGTTKFVVSDDKGNISYTAYCGFENDNSTVTLKATLNGTEDSGASYSCADSDVSISGNKITVTTHDLKYDTAKNITVTAISANNDMADFIVTIEPYYPIRSATRNTDLVMIAKNLNGRFKLMEDINIDISGSNIMYPIGSYNDSTNNNPFTGIFDGGGNTLSNFRIVTNVDYTGLYAYNKGTIKNLKVDNAEFNNDNIDYVGIICGLNEGIIDKCVVTNVTIKAKNFVGGIVGQTAGGKISNSSSTAVVTSTSGNNVGGLIGWVNSNSSSNEITGCYHVSGKVSGINNVGGLIGYVTTNTNNSINAIIADCYSIGDVAGDDSVGGLIGYTQKVKIGIDSNKTYADCTIIGKTNVGGLIGSADSSQDIQITGTSSNYIYSEGTVKGISNVGGLIGNALRNLKASYCKSSAEISSASTNTTPTGSDFSFGGLIGSLSAGSVEYCESSGTINQDKVLYNIGGLIGSLKGNSYIKDCSSESSLIAGSYSNSFNIGGLVGSLENSNVENCSSSGDVLKNNSLQHYVGGLIGTCNSGTIINSYHVTGDVSGGKYIGGLIGYAASSSGTIQIESCHAGCTVLGTSDYVGGLIGKISNTNNGFNITDCYSQSNVTGNNYVGGLIGATGKATIKGVTYASGNVTGNNYVGGLIGYLDSSTVKNSYHDTGSVSGNSYVGGLIGYVSGNYISGAVEVIDCHVRLKNDAVTDVKGSAYVGGLIGNVSCNTQPDAVLISLCSAIADIEATDNYACTGGLIGEFVGNTNNTGNNISQCFTEGKVKADRSGGGLIGIISYCHIIDCYSKSEIYGLEATYRNIGGLVGYAEKSTIENCYAVGVVPTTSRCGGLVGYIDNMADTSFLNSFQRDDRGNDAQRYANYLPYTELITIAPYSGVSPPWDIAFCDQNNPPASIWLIDAGINDGYPHLNYNPPQ